LQLNYSWYALFRKFLKIIFKNLSSKMKIKLLTIAMLLSATFAEAQTDTLFWFAVPEITRGASDLDRPIKLRMTSYAQAAIVTISQPASPLSPTIAIPVPAGTLQSLDLTTWIDSLECKPSNTILNYGLKIQSTNRVSVYYEVASIANPEIFVLKGQTALGNTFWIPSQNLIGNSQSYSPTTNSSFDIISAQNNNIVTITPSNAIDGHPSDTSFSIILNEGQTYSARAVSGLAAQHLGGSRVTSTYPVAITIKDDVLYYPAIGPCVDVGGDQIVPTKVLGMEYIAINGSLTMDDPVFVLAIMDSTVISQNGNVIDTINAGQTRMLSAGDSATYIQTSHPSSILQVSGSGCEFGIDILPQLICTGSDSVVIARSNSQPFFINLLTQNGGQNGFLVNGSPGLIDSSIFKKVPGTNGQWLSAQTSLSTAILPVGGSVLISNPLMLFHLSVINGGTGTGASFGYFSDFACPDTVIIYPPIALNVTSDTSMCKGDCAVIMASASGGAPPLTYSWFPNIGSGQGPFPVCPSSTTNYVVHVTDSIGTEITDTIVVSVNSYPNLTTSPSDTILQGDSITLFASGAVSYSWWPCSYLNTCSGNTVLASPPSTITYHVSGSDSIGCATVDSIVITVDSITQGINYDNHSEFYVSSFPDPFHAGFSLHIFNSAYEKISLIIYDAIGRKVAFENKINENSVFGSQLKSGIYFLELCQGKNVFRLRVVKE
jgi:hypothetical protein